MRKRWIAMTLSVGIWLGFGEAAASAQDRKPIETVQGRPATMQRTRLFLKDGSYQIVFSYKVKGKVVVYTSAERDGASEDIPLALVDLPATERWYREHVLRDAPAPSAAQTPVLSPELAKEEADRAALTPIVAPNLRLPEEDAVLVLDNFEGTPELVPVAQQGSDLNHETAHAVLRKAIVPQAAPHRLEEIPGFRADVQLHVAEPVFYVRVGEEDATPVHGGAYTVDTRNQPGCETPSGGSERSDYVIERVDVRATTRAIETFRLQMLGSGRTQPDVIEMRQEPLPGGHWVKLTPMQPLDFGEYVLLEIVSSHEVNLDVWDFGVHPAAKENVEAIRPEKPRSVNLQQR